MTHEQYLDEAGDAIGWMVHIDGLYRQIERENEAKRRQG